MARTTHSVGVLMRAVMRRKRAGYRIVRLEAALVVSDIERALSAIRAALA